MRARYPSGAAAFVLACFGPAAAAQSLPGGAGMPGGEVQQGTYVHVVRPVEVVEDYTATLDLPRAPSGIDAQFMAESQVHASLTRRGPDLCSGEEGGVADLRIVGMKIFSRDVPFMSGEQESRLFVNQAERRAAIYLRGDVREWGPGPTYCEDGRLELKGSGRGLLRMDYETTSHVLPLNFQAFPRSWQVEGRDLAATCERFRALAFAAYRGLGPRIGIINIDPPAGPIDTSILIPDTPTVPEGMNNGSDMSGEGVLYSITAAQAASNAANVIGVGLALAAGVTGGPVAIGSGLAIVLLGNAIGSTAQGIAGIGMSDFHAALHGFHQGLQADPQTRAHAQHAVRTATFGETTYAGLDADYLTNLAFEMCDALDDAPAPPEGYAAGHFSLPSGTIQLIGAGPVAVAPAAFANGTVRPAGASSIAQALAQAGAMGVEVPDMAAIRAQLPEGVSLDEQPMLMTGAGISGKPLVAGAYEWNVSYTVEIAPEGERIAEGWFDPRG